jgi:phosphopantetheinyl transferase
VKALAEFLVRSVVAHKDDVAVARVAAGRDVGIDIEHIEARPDGFARIAFTAAEREILRGDEWLTRGWAGKEAVAKARGSGLEGNPRGFAVERIDGEDLRVDGTWVRSRRCGEHIIAWVDWTRDPEDA